MAADTAMDDFDFHSTVLRAASRTDFISRLYQEFGRAPAPVQLNDSGLEQERTSFGEANELIKSILDEGPSSSAGIKGRPSMEQISELLMVSAVVCLLVVMWW